MKKLFILALLLFSSLRLNAATVDTVLVESPSMHKSVKNLVILPDGYDPQHADRYPVLYLLHGFGNDYLCWSQIKPNLPELATEKGLIIVCPDGAQSWYWDSPKDPSVRYETYITRELIPYVDRHYTSRARREGRAISGLSMGGHGALWLAFRHQDLFGACGSTSGGVDIRPFPNNWEMSRQLGEYAENPENWETHTVINQLWRLKPGALAIIIDCGTEDFFYQVNEELHRQLLYRNIPHDYLTRPGSHNWDYWNNSIDYQLIFFEEYFQRALRPAEK